MKTPQNVLKMSTVSPDASRDYMASGINIYSFFQISEIIIPDIWKKSIFDIPKQVRILDIQKLFCISKPTISDIRK